MKSHVFHPAAEDEYAGAAAYYARIDPTLGERFRGEIEQLLQEICRQTQSFGVVKPPTRRHVSRVFPYAVLYVDRPESVWIVAIMHCKRKPGYWMRRLR